ncbi:hypothetical protein T265_13620, partial [Opisthorchis viverrini]
EYRFKREVELQRALLEAHSKAELAKIELEAEADSLDEVWEPVALNKRLAGHFESGHIESPQYKQPDAPSAARIPSETFLRYQYIGTHGIQGEILRQGSITPLIRLCIPGERKQPNDKNKSEPETRDKSLGSVYKSVKIVKTFQDSGTATLFPCPITVSFPELKCAFGSVDPQALWQYLWSNGALFNALYANSGGCMKVYGKLSPEFITSGGAIQDHPLSPCLFNFAIDTVMEHSLPASNARGVKVLPGRPLRDIEWTEDIALLGSDAVVMQITLKNVTNSALRFGTRFAPVKCKVLLQKEHGQPQPFEPVPWNEFFNIRDDIELEVGTFRIYRRGVEGPLLFFIHGGGFSALTWAVLSATITEQVKCQCLAVDMRGHGDTVCQNDDDLSMDTLAKDVIKIIFAMYPTEAPPIILVGHSMGGAVAVHVAHKRTIPSLAGLVVIDVVEGSALNSLQGMTTFLKSRPQFFQSLSHAIEWSVRSCQLRNVQSARVSFPGQLKRIATGQTATCEMEQGKALIFSCPKFSPNPSITSLPLDSPNQTNPTDRQHPEPIAETADDEDIDEQQNNSPEQQCDHEAQQVRLVHSPVTFESLFFRKVSDYLLNSMVDESTKPDEHLEFRRESHSTHLTDVSFTRSHNSVQEIPRWAQYTWRIDLMNTQPFWQGWFSGLSQRFLSIPEPKLLLLAGVDRLDKDLTIGQMQGKFQVHVFPKCGHAVQEDAPEKVAECLAKFLVRNRLTEARSNCGN